MIKSKICPNNPFLILKNFEHELENVSEDQEKVIEKRLLASIIKAELSQQLQDNLLSSKVLKHFLHQLSELSKTINSLKQDMKKHFTEQRTTTIIIEVLDLINKSSFRNVNTPQFKLCNGRNKINYVLFANGCSTIS